MFTIIPMTSESILVHYLVRHIIIELNDCPFDVLNNLSAMENVLFEAANAINTEVIKQTSHQFTPQGVTALLIVGASHLSVHTWPENGYASFDMVVCTDDFDLNEVIALIKDRFKAQQVSFIEFRRGLVK